ncbi:MAG TPA: hemerythrin domain-containing protein [Terriglobales bacterium]|nr:hemerythrin domain-containing protein [Terriglobales bacterium]
MLRDKSLIPLSRQHQHALALCVRISRAPLATAREVQAWQSEVEQHFALEIQHHFAAEEKDVFPVARQYADLVPLVQELLAEHARLRGYFEQARMRALDGPALRQFAELLSAHIRKEERQLFEEMQKQMGSMDLEKLGGNIEESLAPIVEVCIPPTEEILKRS